MTSYSSMAARGREEARTRTAGRRKPVVIRLDHSETPEPDMPPGCYIVEATLTGQCGHVLERTQWKRYDDPRYPAATNWKLDAMRRKVGRRMTCQHDDCRIVP